MVKLGILKINIFDMPKYCSLAKDFFKSWSSEMTYVLGYIAADGNISIGKRGNYYLALEGIDKELIIDIKRVLGAGHTITSRRRNVGWNKTYRLQIGSKEMVGDLIKLGLTPNKSKRLHLPIIPKKYLGDFIRGYFDGDGNIFFSKYRRTDRRFGDIKHIHVLFTSASRKMLDKISSRLENDVHVTGAKLMDLGTYHRLYYYRAIEIRKIYELFYGQKPTLYLKRKFVYFKEALEKMNMGAYLRLRPRYPPGARRK